MDRLTPDNLAQLRDLLLHRRGELRAELQAAELARREPLPAVQHEVADRKDEADARQGAEIADRQAQLERGALAETEAALRRLDAGGYGDCLACGEPIALPRLLVQPAAPRCAACQALTEPPRGHAG